MKEAHDGPGEPEDGFGPPGSRFAAVSRRAFLARSAGLGVGAVIALAACGHNDAEVFARGPSSTSGAAGTGASSTTRAGGAPSPQVGPTSSAATPASGSMSVRFTYKPSTTGGRVNNPYVAVWIEDSGGNLVNTLGLWYLQNQKGTRYLNELQRWSSVDGSSNTLDTVSSATRTPGDYALVWKLTDTAGKAVGAGSYFVCIEAAREHGPYSLIRQLFTLSSASFKTDLSTQGELTNATIAYPAG